MKMITIYILTDAPMPTGMAPTNRILSYAKGFSANGVKCEIIIFRKTDKSHRVNYASNEGEVDGVRYRYLFSYGIKSPVFLKRRLDDLLGDLRLFIAALSGFNKSSVLIYYSSRTTPVLFLKIAKFFRHFTLLKEESEHPSVYMREMNSFTSFVFARMHYRVFDGYLLMTRNLLNYFQDKYPDKPALLVPMTVDLSLYKPDDIKKEKSITYIGSLNNEKDGIDILLEAFLKLSNDYPDYELNLYGKPKNQEIYKSYKSFVSNSGLTGRVFFKGNISNKKIPEILLKSGVLVMARPDSIQAQNGFPTKLGEYLATGNPVVVTSVGEIPFFLKDKESAFIAEPGDVESLRDKIVEVLESDNIAHKVGLNGRKVAEQYFNNVIQTNSIIKFVHQL